MPAVSHTQTEKKNMTKTEENSDRERGKEVEKKNEEPFRKDDKWVVSLHKLPLSSSCLYLIVCVSFFFYQSIIGEDNAERQPGLII